MQNLMMGHASISTFVKHYLARRITVDTQAVVRGIKPQAALMRAVCTMSRSIDRRRPRQLTAEQSSSVNNLPVVRSLLDRRTRLKRRAKTSDPDYAALSVKISRERQHQRHNLLKDIQAQWEREQPVLDVERQLSGKGHIDDPKTVPEVMDPAHLELASSVLSSPGTNVTEEMQRRNRAIRAVMVYCGIEEGQARTGRALKRGNDDVAAMPVSTSTCLKDDALAAAKRSVYNDHRPKVCFVCLGNDRLPTLSRVYAFHTPGDLSKHFKRKHLRQIDANAAIDCELCEVTMQNKMHFQRHAHDIHGLVSTGAV